MKIIKLPRLSTLTLCIICMLLYSCTAGPSEQGVIDLVKPDGFVKKIEVQKLAKSKKIGDTKVFTYSVYMNYISPGMSFGYVDGCPEAHCCNDIEYEIIKEYMIEKSQWDDWQIFESRTIDKKEIQRFWRPESKSMEEFYKDLR